jgi:hypothetical protein
VVNGLSLGGRLGDLADADRPASAWLPGVRLRFEFDLLTLGQFIEGGLFHRAAVEKDVFGGALRLNEAEPSIADHALDDAYCHDADLLTRRAGQSEGRRLLGRSLAVLAGTAPIGRARPVGTLSRPPHRLSVRQSPRLGLRYEVAPPLCFAQDAVSLHPLPEAAQAAAEWWR